MAGWTDQRVENFMGNLLRVGVSAAAIVVLVSGGVYLVRHGHEVPRYHVFAGEPAELTHAPGIVGEAWGLHSLGFIQFGLLMLIATPVARVVFSVIAFGMQRDWVYVAITLIVLGLLCFSLTGSHL
ncbi:MAG: DUF1634 domain-containing protein [Candidatus Acidiferrales bacterium]